MTTTTLFQNEPVPPGRYPDWYFITDNGKYVIRERIKAEAQRLGLFKELTGKHFRVQLEAMELIEHFDKGSTPMVCPYSLF